MTNDSLQELLDNQENILQSTRGMHYVFQAIFLGIGFAILTIGYSLSIEIDKGKGIWFREVIVVIFLIIFCLAIFYFGKKFLNEYSSFVTKRGIVIDVLHYIRLLKYQNALENFYKEVFKEYNEQDIIFVIIKIVERIVSNYEPSIESLNKAIEDIKSHRIPHFNLVKFNKFEKLFYVCFFGNIYISEIPENKEKWNARPITPIRNGHKKTFQYVWFIHYSLSIILEFFTLGKII